ncbi:hypothetical protein MLD38_033177 [Melastoma candidum]|uniref:Uncharacterized protein n=1 Tax=Melastoma candidum TaxID=119954 RepID=A0ACB9MA91_9MYRT|nr:hypothetical protein MLD38_033177 [Melastoma candidum]
MASMALSTRKDPRFKAPKIRVIHLFAPEIIKTDTANFRDLVQSLTGNAAAAEANHDCGPERKRARELEPRVVVPERPKPRKAVHFDLFRGLDSRERLTVKEERMDCGNYLKDFIDLDDGFMWELRGLQPTPHFEAPHPYTLI